LEALISLQKNSKQKKETKKQKFQSPLLMREIMSIIKIKKIILTIIKLSKQTLEEKQN
jgi:hypothetical protein